MNEGGFTGIKYPADYRRGGRADGAKNYVIFNEKDLQITNHLRFFRGKEGEAYGFTVDGKIYIDPKHVNAETPIHEYAHLWATALQQKNAKEWQNVVGLMKGTDIWEEVKRKYPELKTDEELADEVLATYSGQRGAERLREEMRRINESNGDVFTKAEAIHTLERVKQAIKRFWRAVADFLHIRYTSAEQVADQVLGDLLSGVNPNVGVAAEGKAREQFIGENGAAAIDHAEDVSTRMDNLAVAREMEEAKKDAKAIKIATGWERGADGKWRYEVPDIRLKPVDEWLNKRKKFTLADIIEANDPIFKMYPKLKGITINKNYSKSDAGGYYDKEANEIKLPFGFLKNNLGSEVSMRLALNEFKHTLGHEIQHVIQHEEGFANGGSPETFSPDMPEDARREYESELNEYERLANEYNSLSKFERLEDRNRRLREEAVSHRDRVKAIAKRYRLGMKGYRRISGEVEARNVEKRMNMTPIERMTTLASETEDVAREDQIFLGVRESKRTSEEEARRINGQNGERASLRGGTFIRSGSYFSGGGLLEEGLKEYLDPKVAVEFSEKISGVYSDNFGHHIVTADVRNVDPRELTRHIDGPVEYFHASPVCKNFSKAKRDAGEVELDKETAQSTADFIRENHPKVVTIENVKGYRNSEALKIITDQLTRMGYDWDAHVYNAADYGGYTKRERLIVRAVRDGVLPPLPQKLSESERPKGWMDAVEDLISTLPEKKSGVPKWMDERLKAEGIDWRHIDKPLYVFGQGNSATSVPHAFADELLPTLRTKGGDVIIMPDGRVLRVTPRVLARVTGLADDYKMPITDDMAHTIIGNGIPTQMSEHVIGPLLEDVFNGGEKATDESLITQRRRENVFASGEEGEGQRNSERSAWIDPLAMSEDEKSHRGNLLLTAPAINVASNQIVKTTDLTARQAAEKWWMDNVGDESLHYNTEIGDVEINQESIEGSLAHGYGQTKLDAITSLKNGFSNAVYLGTMPDFVRNTPKVVQNHYFAYPINYNGNRNYVFCRAMEDNNKNRLYVHEVFLADNIQKEDNTLQTAAHKPHGGIALYKSILANVLNAANVANNSENSQKTVDKNVEKASKRGTPNLNLEVLNSAQQIYEESLKGYRSEWDEAWHDSLVSVKRLQEALAEVRGTELKDFENVYWHAVTLSSVTAAEQSELLNKYIQPLMDTVKDLCKKHGMTQDDLEVYLNCKHGLERNQLMAEREAAQTAERNKEKNAKAAKLFADGKMEEDAYNDYVAKHPEDSAVILEKLRRKRDYSGLTDIFNPKNKMGAYLKHAS